MCSGGTMKARSSEQAVIQPDKIIIHYGSQRDGYVFRLHPLSLLQLQERYPARCRTDSVFIGYDKRRSPEEVDSSVWQHVSQLLTGLSTSEIEQNGGFVVVHPVSQQEIYPAVLVHA